MKIGIAISQTPTYSETFFNNKIKGLKDSGMEVTLFVQKGDPSFDLCKVRIAPNFSKSILSKFYNVFIGTLIILLYLKRARRFVNYKRNDCCSWLNTFKSLFSNTHILSTHVDWLHYGFATMAIGREPLAKSINAKMAVSCRGYDMDVYPIKHKKIYKNLWKYVNKLHVISEYMLNKAFENGFNPKTQYQIITPALEVDNFNFFKIEGKSSLIRILTIARLHWIKGLIKNLEAMAVIKQQGYNFQYSIIGEGPEYEQIMYAIYQLNLKDNVMLIGKLNHEETLNKLKEADMYIQYSLSEGFCNAVLEAQAMGCLTIVSDGGALPENVIQNQTGWIVPKQKPNELAQKIIEIIKLSEEEKNKIRQQARQRVIQDFNLSKQAQEFVEFYTS